MSDVGKSHKWIPCKSLHGYIINDKRLWDKERVILITYKTMYGRRYVRPAMSRHGKIEKKIGGEIIAWMEMPEPYKGD